MQPTRELPKERWADYLQEITVHLRNVPVSVEVMEPSRNGRAGVEVRRMALEALVYDRRDDVFEVAAARGGARLPTVVRRMVEHPIRIEVDSLDSPAAITPNVISVLDRQGVRTVVRLAAEANTSE